MCSPCCIPAPIWPVNRSCCMRPGNFRKAMSSIGGIRRKAGASAPTVRMTCSGCPMSLPVMWPSPATLELLGTSAGYLESRLLRPEEDSLYDLPVSGNLSGTIFEHCIRAIRHGLRFGRHGLPLMGTGDWNDGMDKVGFKGSGESVWLAFFLHDVLMQFCRYGHGLWKLSFCRRMPVGSSGYPYEDSPRGMGWPMVQTRLFRRRHSARFEE